MEIYIKITQISAITLQRLNRTIVEWKSLRVNLNLHYNALSQSNHCGMEIYNLLHLPKVLDLRLNRTIVEWKSE